MAAAIAIRTVERTAPEAPARRTLQTQIRRLEAALAARVETAGRAPAPCGPRLLTLAELERARDALVGAVAAADARATQEGAERECLRQLLEAARADPGAHRRLRIPRADLGLPGCGVYAVRPRLGLIGMLAGWWELTLSSGCP
jgi:hypothetical protein